MAAGGLHRLMAGEAPARPMNYRIEHDRSAKRQGFEPYSYLIYEDDRRIAKYWHDYRGDEQRIEFLDGRGDDLPFGRMTEFIEGGGPEPLRISERGRAYLSSRKG
jgi:hypothetical protein